MLIKHLHIKRPYLLRLASLLLPICIFTTATQATEIEASLRPASASPSASRYFISPLEEVGFTFDRCIKLLDNAEVHIMCDDKIVATAHHLDVVNHIGETHKQGTLIAKFDKQNLPKGKTYTICLSKASVGWVECYNDIQVVNMAYSYDIDIPNDLGTPHTDLLSDSPVPDSDNLSLCHWYDYEIAPIDTPEFLLYRNDELIDRVPADVSWDWNLGEVRPRFPQKTNFEFGVRYSLVLPAGSISSLYRDDIVNREHTLNFIGYYTEPDAPFSYTWCSLFTDHSNLLGEVSFTYTSPVSLSDGAAIELYEGDCKTLIKSAPAYLNTDVNCYLVCCNFGGYEMTSGKSYTIVIPDDAVYLQQHPDIKAAGGTVKIVGTVGITTLTPKQQNVDNTLYDVTGRQVKNPIPGSLYIKNGWKIIYQQQ